MGDFALILLLLALVVLVAPWALMLALGIAGVSLGFADTIALSVLLGIWGRIAMGGTSGS